MRCSACGKRCDEVIAGDVFSEEELEALHNIQVPGPQT